MPEQTACTGTERAGARLQALQKRHKRCLEAVSQLREQSLQNTALGTQIAYHKPQYRNKNYYLRFHRQIWAVSSSSPVPALQPGHMCCRKTKKSPASFCLEVASHQHSPQPYPHTTAPALAHDTADSGTFTLFTSLCYTNRGVASVETRSSSLNRVGNDSTPLTCGVSP